MINKAKLYYFDGLGRAEPIILLLQLADIECQREPVPIGSINPDLKEKLEFGKLPMLEVDGLHLVESKAILRYIGLRSGYYPTDPLNNYKVNSLIDRYIDLENAFQKVMFSKEEDKQELRKDFIEKELIPAMTAIEKRLKEKDLKDCLVLPCEFTVADVLYLYFFWTHIFGPKKSEVLGKNQFLEDNFPLCKQFVETTSYRFPSLQGHN